jgi:hypothetical protein
MLKAVSKQTVTLYWEIGKAVSEKVKKRNGANRLWSNSPKIYKPSIRVSEVFLLEISKE